MIIYSIVGWIGMALILSAYFLLSIKKLKANSFSYHLLNLFGGAGIVVNTFVNKALPAMTLNIIWALIAIISIIKISRSKRK